MGKAKIILGIETSCDETAAAVVQKQGDRIQILSNIVASSANLQSKYGGIIPEQAAREQIKSIIPVIKEALIQSNLYPPSSKNYPPSSIVQHPAIDAIAVTQGPGLIGSLLVGVETAKTLALVWEKPLIPVNHLMGHFYANFIEPTIIPSFPCIGLLVSGGHTDLILMKNHNSYIYLGGTRDDAAGECFDKCARLLGLPYPGGPEISRLASQGSPARNADGSLNDSRALRFKLPSPMIDSDTFDFSFSGLKTAVVNLVTNNPSLITNNLTDLCAAIEQAIVAVLVKKTITASQTCNVGQVIVAGGVAANKKLISDFRLTIRNKQLPVKLFVPPPYLCTDNAAMIASRAFFEKPQDPLSIQANPNLNLSEHLPS